MLFETRDKGVISNHSLSQAIAVCKTAANLARQLGVEPDMIYKWRNEEIKIPLPMGIRIEAITNIDFSRLCPFDEKANALIKNRHTRKQLIKIETDNILLEPSSNQRRLFSERPILIGADRVLISGLHHLEEAKIKDFKTITAIVIDLEALFLGLKTIHEWPSLVMSEHIEIGLRFEQLIGNHPGTRHDLKSNAPQKISQNKSQLLPIWGQVKGRKDVLIAKRLNYSTNTYYRAKHVYLHGIPELIDAMNRKHLRINTAFEIAKDSEATQRAWMSKNALNFKKGEQHV